MTGLIAAVALMLPVADKPPKVDKPVDPRWKAVKPWNGKLNRIARCESGMRWHIATGNGFYGGLQFSLSTWWSVGGRGMPHTHTALEQKYRAVKVFHRRGGWGDWPVCGWR
jgi:hypothetical protein